MAEFRAILLEKHGETVAPSIQTLDSNRLPDGDVTIRVTYSTLNYKDGLVLKGQGGLVRNYPHIPGIDLIGIVEDPGTSKFNVGDKVISTGWRVGEVWWGGYATMAKLKSEWLVKAPDGLSEQGVAVFAVASWVGIWWVTEAVPIAVTAILPVVLFPLSGALDITATTTAYGHKYVFLYLGGFLCIGCRMGNHCCR